jgi:Icc-related predicted phosphoesterase
MIIYCIADLHGNYPELEGGDLLIVAGDYTARDTPPEYIEMACWMARQKYRHRVFIGGNHDNQMTDWFPMKYAGADYLFDSGIEFEGLKIWGSPWTKTFPGMNPHCKAFTVDTEEELAQKWTLIPNDTDILITHSPSFGNLDITERGESVGSLLLWMKMLIVRPKIHVFGHIHEAYGYAEHANGIKLVNASHVNERYKPVNKPIRILL